MVACNDLPDQAFIWLAWYDRRPVTSPLRECNSGINSQAALGLPGVAFVTMLDKERANSCLKELGSLVSPARSQYRDQGECEECASHSISLMHVQSVCHQTAEAAFTSRPDA